MIHPLSGIYAAVITPLYPNYAVDESALPYLLDFLAGRGCHGALLFGTTGEGPSFAAYERIEACKVALQVRQAHPNFKLLLGTGTPSLDETAALTRAAFDLGFDGAVALPPYYFRKASDDGLFAWFSEVIRRAVPSGGAFFGYHIPPVSGVALSFELLARLKDAFPNQFTGLKDSSADREHGRLLGERFGNDLLIFCGTDPMLGGALKGGAGGCITAPANLFSPVLRRLWEAYLGGADPSEAQAQIEAYRAIIDRYPPAPPLLKALLARLHPGGMPRFPVRPPLTPVSREVEDRAYAELQSAGLV
jgi:4-hydroxy-tetrahydrodipicolinate synthase